MPEPPAAHSAAPTHVAEVPQSAAAGRVSLAATGGAPLRPCALAADVMRPGHGAYVRETV